jgi:hypothetical protein
VQLTFSRDDLRPIVEACLAELLDRFGDPARVAYPEPEAAQLLGVEQVTLADERRRGQIKAAKIGRSWSYTRADLVAFVERRKNADQRHC